MIAQSRKEEIRWRALQTLDQVRPEKLSRALLRRTLSDRFALSTTVDELKTELDYLEGKGFVQPGTLNTYALTADGVDIIEGSIEPPVGITGIESPSDLALSRRREIRWRCLKVLDAGRPVSVAKSLVLSVLNDQALTLVQTELEREINYLRDRGFLADDGDRPGLLLKLTPRGVDLVEYKIDCPASIGRPPAYDKEY
ncbi:MAG: hypothetical protein AAGD09_11470 [Cyanobacteria bacterium P01_F01_bin.56]